MRRAIGLPIVDTASVDLVAASGMRGDPAAPSSRRVQHRQRISRVAIVARPAVEHVRCAARAVSAGSKQEPPLKTTSPTSSPSHVIGTLAATRPQTPTRSAQSDHSVASSAPSPMRIDSQARMRRVPLGMAQRSASRRVPSRAIPEAQTDSARPPPPAGAPCEPRAARPTGPTDHRPASAGDRGGW